MIGNDVIDLACAAVESNWRRPGWLQKIFTENEQQYIAGSATPDLVVWSLWSRKEAAYKIWNRKSRLTAFNPLQFECNVVKNGIGTVVGFDKLYHTHTVIAGEQLHTVAVTNQSDLDNIIRVSDRIPVRKISGLPYWPIGADNQIPCSVSHHGRFYQVVYIS